MYNEELGFTRVIQLIINHKIPIIGHNMIYDVAFVFNQFIGELPLTFEEFAN